MRLLRSLRNRIDATTASQTKSAKPAHEAQNKLIGRGLSIQSAGGRMTQDNSTFLFVLLMITALFVLFIGKALADLFSLL